MMDTHAQSRPSFRSQTTRLEKQSHHELPGLSRLMMEAVNQGHIADTVVSLGSHMDGEPTRLVRQIDEGSGYDGGRLKRRRLCSGVEPDLSDTRADGPSYDQSGKDLPSGYPKQVCLAKSRLKSIPSDTRLCRTACTISILGEEMGRLLEQVQTSGPFAISESGRSSWDFNSMAEAMDVDQRLRATVTAWAKKQNLDANVVEYTLLSQVKGKSRA